MNPKKIITILLILLTGNLLFSQTSSNDLNNSGYYSYIAGDYYTAIQYFKKSIEADYSNHLAHYNLACTMSLLYFHDNQPISTIIYHLEQAESIEETMIENILSDSDLDNIRDSHDFISFILNNKVFDSEAFEPAPGSCAPGFELYLNSDGTFQYHSVWEGMWGDVASAEPVFSGLYAKRENSVILYFPEAMKQSIIQADAGGMVWMELPSKEFVYGEYYYNEYFGQDMLSINLRNSNF